MRKTMQILDSWEGRRGGKDSNSHLVSTKSSSKHVPSTTSSRELYSMAALEKAMAVNTEPLLQFAATKDFTAENVLFLIQVRRWKEAFARAARPGNEVSESARSHLFNTAVQIYTSRVNDKTTDFPINIEHKVRQDLDAIFSPAVPTGQLTQSEHLPYDEADAWTKSPKSPTTFDRMESSDSGETLTGSPVAFREKPEPLFPPHPGVAPLGESRAKMRAGFDEHVFDAAESSIMYLVLTNTWQKFVREHRPSISTLVDG